MEGCETTCINHIFVCAKTKHILNLLGLPCCTTSCWVCPVVPPPEGEDLVYCVWSSRRSTNFQLVTSEVRGRQLLKVVVGLLLISDDITVFLTLFKLNLSSDKCVMQMIQKRFDGACPLIHMQNGLSGTRRGNWNPLVRSWQPGRQRQ